ncbi:MAG TPA: hypothetical protein ENN99_02840, partial [Chloroflexi bacterium]|nr:hypothetical protein [Chloroflexota bacterium]
SLNRLEMDCVDLIQIHGADREAQVNSDELWEAFTRARDAGKARFNGLSVNRHPKLTHHRRPILTHPCMVV